MSDHTLTYSTTGKPHPYHIVRPSVWPIIGAFAGGTFALGMLLFMHKESIGSFPVGIKGPILGLIAILAVMFFWWKNVLFEAVTERVHTDEAMQGLRYGMALFIASEVMFFFAFFWAFFDSSLFINDVREVLAFENTGGVWPPKLNGHDMHIINPFDLPFLMTMILLLSGCAVTWAHHEILGNHQKTFRQALVCTVMLGVLFLFFQVFEFLKCETKHKVVEFCH